jgi:hypothetical protein
LAGVGCADAEGWIVATEVPAARGAPTSSFSAFSLSRFLAFQLFSFLAE